MALLTIDPAYQELLIEKLSKLNRKSAKLGLAPITYTFTPRTENRHFDLLDDEGRVYRSCLREVMVLDVELTGQAPKLNGWTLICRVEHTDAGCLVSGPAYSKEDLTPWHNCDARECDHCHTHRDRKDTFVLRNEAGETVRVGRSCLADFVRNEDAVAIAKAALWSDFYPENEEGYGGWANPVYSVQTVIAFAIASMRVDGGYKKDHGTANSVRFAMNPPSKELNAIGKKEWQDRQTTEADSKQAAEIIEWGKAQSGSDYLHNVQVACSLAIGTDRTFGILVSVPAAYHRAKGYEATKKTTKQKVMPKDGRYEITGTIKTLRAVESDWGTALKMLVVVETPEGTWNGWSTVPSELRMRVDGVSKPEEGDVVTFKATVQPKELGFAILSRPTVTKPKNPKQMKLAV